MCNANDLPLSLESSTFSALHSDFNQVLRIALQGMDETSQDTAEINVKVKISLTPDSAPDYTVPGYGQHTRSITRPKFDHTVTAVLTRKEKKTGTLSGNYELVWDRESCMFVMRPVDDGQESLFDGDKANSFADSHGLPAPDGGQVVNAEFQVLGEDGPEAPSREEAESAYNWLHQFVDTDLRALEAMGNYTVRDKDNRVILTSATGSGSVFYASADILAPHVGHSLICTEGPDTIVIMCEDCDDVIFRLKNPAADDEEGPGEAEGGPADDQDGFDRPEDGEYHYQDGDDVFGDSKAGEEEPGDDE